MFMKFQLLLLCVVGIISCKPMPKYQPKVFTTDALQEDRLGVLDSRYSSADLCADYQLLNNLIFFVHNDATIKRPADRRECPKNFSDFVSMSRAVVAELKDLHTQIQFGNGIDSIKIPVITQCAGDPRCSSMNGSSLLTVPTSVQNKFYGFIFIAKEKSPLPVEILRVDGRSLLDYRDEMDSKHLYSHSKGNWSQSLPNYIFARSVISERGTKPMQVEVKNLLDQKILTFTLAYNVPQKVFGSQETSTILQTLGVGRDYGCTKVLKDSAYPWGACLDKSGKIFVWLYIWPDAKLFKAWNKELSAWLVANKGSESTIHLDLRANGGGDPIAVVDFMCTFGDESTLKAMQALSLNVRTWPQSITVSGQTIKTAELKAFDNLHIRKIDETFAIKHGDLSEPRFHTLSIWERASRPVEDCASSRNTTLKGMKWKILTNGGEFSSTENFLFLAQTSPDKFKVYGRPTMGGSGNPTWIPLPRTNAGIRISSARDVYNSDVIIEKTGIKPDVPIDLEETASEFERRFLKIIKGGSINDFATDQMPAALKKQYIGVP